MREVWLETLLLSFITSSVFSCQAKPCVVGELGESVFLPCLYNGSEDLASSNISLEWRRGAEVMYRAVWMKGHEERFSVKGTNRTEVSSLPPTGNFTMKLNDIQTSDVQNYSLYLTLPDNGASVKICTVCLKVADGVKSNPDRKYELIWVLSTVLCVLVAVLVTIALCFQRKWDKERRIEREDDSACEDTEMIMMDTEYLNGLSNRETY